MSRSSYNSSNKFKVLLIGTAAAKKRDFIKALVGRSFDCHSTIGTDFYIKQMQVDQREIIFQIWDTAGQERFRTFSSSYFRGANAVFLVYSSVVPETFVYLKSHIGQVLSEIDEKIPVAMIDTAGSQAVSSEQSVEYQRFVQEHQLVGHTTCDLNTGSGVEYPLILVARSWFALQAQKSRVEVVAQQKAFASTFSLLSLFGRQSPPGSKDEDGEELRVMTVPSHVN
ncbi:MAG: GTP-binding protein [Coxiellaceae bacterium]|nr:GTP-binding protein [Coxiellaceae bacterium]